MGKVIWGRMVTGEVFITDERRQKYVMNSPPLTVDMETAAIAHVCYGNGIRFLAIRCVTDTAAQRQSLRYRQGYHCCPVR
nr:hypothetical protein [uncultured Acetatifactor sp.]